MTLHHFFKYSPIKSISCFQYLLRCRWIVLLVLLWGGVVSCSNHSHSLDDTMQAKVRGIYYWKTVFELTSSDSLFLQQHQINRLYLRFFDVDYDTDLDGVDKSLPIATTRFRSSAPQGVEIVPVVYITNAAITRDPHFGTLLYERIQAMAKSHGLGPIREIQLDCDWNNSTRPNFFRLCQDMTDLAHADSVAVSSTIRLHQLKSEAPPVDRGVLMVYNTGSLHNADAKNSILDVDDVKPLI